MSGCETVNSRIPRIQEYTEEEQTALANELDEKCPVTKDKYGNEVHECPMIDRAMDDYGSLRGLIRKARD